MQFTHENLRFLPKYDNEMLKIPYIRIRFLQDKARKNVASYQVLDKNINC